MELVWLLLDGGRDAVRRPGLGFLGTSRFAVKTLGFGGCKSLDFLGFSRPNLDLSMGYTSFSAEDFSTALLSSRKRPGNGNPTIGHAEGTDFSQSKLSSISDFLQEIAVGATSLRTASIQKQIAPGPIAESYALEQTGH
jgi:hypothetical protein